MPERVSGPPPLMLPGAALGQGQHFRLWTVPEGVSGPSALMLPGAALGSLAARFCWQGQHFRPPPLMLSGASTWEPRGSFLLAGAALEALDGARARFGAPPPLMLPGAALGSLAPRFCWQGQHLRLWTVPERVSGPPPLMLPGAALGSLAPRFSGAALQALDGARARFGAPPLMLPGAGVGSLAPRFCWQGQHFRLWTVPERVSGPPPLMLPGAALASLAARFCWQGQHFRLWTVPERVSGPPPLDADTHTHTHTHSLTYTCALTCSLAQTPNCIHCYTLPKKIRMWGYPVL